MFDDAKACAAHLRHALKAAGIAARCRVLPGSRTAVQVYPVAHRATFGEDAQRRIRTMAVELGMTFVRGLPIDVDRMTDTHGMELHLPARRSAP